MGIKIIQKKQDGRKNNGGARPGSGPKPTGRNYRSIGFSIHNDDIDAIRAFVYEKKKELEDKRAAGGTQVIRTSEAVVTIEVPSGKIVKAEVVSPRKKKPVEEIKKEFPKNDFVAKRRNAKLGIK